MPRILRTRIKCPQMSKKGKSTAQKVANNIVKAVEKKEGRTGYLAKAAKYAKPAISLGLDGVSTMFPFLKAPREVLRAVAGFDERRVESVDGMAGGEVVRTMDAPVSFARNKVQTGWRSLGASADGGEVWSFTDMMKVFSGYTVVTSGTANTYNVTSAGVSPISSVLYPNFFQTALVWQRWRPLKMVVHYCHFAPTSVQAAVMLAIGEDVSATSLPPAATNTFMGMDHSIQGSCYEDFSISAIPTPWKAGTWLFMDTSSAANNAGYRQVYAGSVYLATDANTTTSAPLGYVYTELLFEVSGKRPPLPGITLLTQFDVSVAQLPQEHRRPYYDYVCAKMWTELAALTNTRAAGDGLAPEADHPLLSSFLDYLDQAGKLSSTTAQPRISTAKLTAPRVQ